MMETDYDFGQDGADDDDELPEFFEVEGVDSSKRNCFDCSLRVSRILPSHHDTHKHLVFHR